MTRNISNDAAIRTLIEDQAKALRAKDAKAALLHYAPDSVIFDLAPPLQHKNKGAAAEQELIEWFTTWHGPIGYETRDFSIVAHDDVAFCHGFVRMHGTKVEGEHVDLWVRQTSCLQKIDGTWKITHDHMSVPFYMDGSYKAAVDLKP